jgi:hypothetical protein
MTCWTHDVQGMAELVPIAGDLASAGAALAGLVLVFLAHTAGTFENYDPKDRPAVRAVSKSVGG